MVWQISKSCSSKVAEAKTRRHNDGEQPGNLALKTYERKRERNTLKVYGEEKKENYSKKVLQ